MKKWFIAHSNIHELNTEKFKIIEEIDRKVFRESIERVYDYEYLIKLKDFVKLNYKDFEVSIYSLVKDSNNSKNMETKLLETHQTNIQRTFFNLVNSHRIITDHIKHNLSSYINKEHNDYKFISRIASHFYDDSQAYKIIDNLRNYCQHKNLIPIEIIRRPNDGEIQIIINKEALREDNKLNKKLKVELDDKEYLFFIVLIEEWFNNINKIYEYYFDLFVKYSKNQAERLLKYNKNVNYESKLYLIGGFNIKSLDQYAELPTQYAIEIINHYKTKKFNENIEIINSF